MHIVEIHLVPFDFRETPESLDWQPNSLDLTLTLREGRIWAGLIPLGPAPVLHLR